MENSSRCPRKIRQPQWRNYLEDKVKTLRKTYRLWGRAKIKIILEREYKIDVSVTTVGRILKKLILQGILKPVLFYQYQGPLKMDALRREIQEFENMYNTFRPHQALQYKTPMQYWASLGVS